MNDGKGLLTLHGIRGDNQEIMKNPMSSPPLPLLLSLCMVVWSGSIGGAEVGVRLRFGLTDEAPRQWNGTVTVSPGRVASIDGWRFQRRDRVEGTSGWRASTRSLARRRSNNPKKAGRSSRKGRAANLIADNGVVLVLEDVTEASKIDVKTAQGAFRFRLSDIPYGTVIERRGGAVDIERVAATQQLTNSRGDDDFPAIAVESDGTVHVAFISFTPGLDRDARAHSFTQEPEDLSFLAKPTGGDRLWLRTRAGGRWGDSIAVTPGKGDLYKCALALASDDWLWVVWSEQRNGNFDIWARPYRKGELGKALRISSDRASDVNPVAVADRRGNVWIAWQGARDGNFAILERHQTRNGWSAASRVSSRTGSCWQPALAAAKDGRIAIAWDTYDRGDYDVWLREFDASGGAGHTAAGGEQRRLRGAGGPHLRP